jgi:hypothetical protein
VLEPLAKSVGMDAIHIAMIGTHSTPTPKPCSAIGQNTSVVLGLTSSCASCRRRALQRPNAPRRSGRLRLRPVSTLTL